MFTKFKLFNDQQISAETTMWLCLPSVEARYEDRKVTRIESNGNSLAFKHVEPNMFIPHHDVIDEGVEYRTYEILSIWDPLIDGEVIITQVDSLGEIDQKTWFICEFTSHPELQNCHVYLDHHIFRKQKVANLTENTGPE